MHSLIIIVGPIASGKTTLSREIARLLSESGERARAIDIDTIVLAIDPNDSFKSARQRRSTWVKARRQLVGEASRLFASGADAVVVAAPFFYEPNLAALRKELNEKYRLCVFKLRTPYPTRLLRFMLRRTVVNEMELDNQVKKLTRHPVNIPGTIVRDVGRIPNVAQKIVRLYQTGNGEVSSYFRLAV